MTEQKDGKDVKLSITIQKINDVKVKPFVALQEKKPPRHFDLFGMNPYPNIGIMASKGSGKTSVLGTILTKSIGWGTEVIAFVPTGYQDSAWQEIRDYMANLPSKLYNKFTLYTEIVDDETGENHLQRFLDEQKRISSELDDDSQDDEKKDAPAVPANFIVPLEAESDDEKDEAELREEIERKIQRSKYTFPRYILIFDDLSDDLRNRYVEKLLKTNRHLKAMIIISSHQLTDMRPASTTNLDFVLVFGGIEERYLEALRKRIALRIPFNVFSELYRTITAERFNFLWISTRDQKFRKNFNESIAFA